MKAAIALSVLCLFASIAFYVSSTREEPVVFTANAEGATAPQKKDHGRGVSGFSSFGDERPTSALDDSASTSAEATVDDGYGGDGESGPEDDAWEGSISGRVVSRGELPEDAVVFLVPAKLFEEPVAEGEALPEVDGMSEVDEARALEAGVGMPEQLAAATDVAGDQAPDEEEVVAEEEGYPEGPYVDPVYPDENGEFTAFVAPGEYALIARAPGHLPVKVEGITVQKGEDVTGVMMELEQGLHVAGYVRAEEGTVSEVEVMLEGEGYSKFVYTDLTGAFDFEGLPPGRFTVRAASPAAGAAAKEVRGGETTVALDLRMRTISGTVIGEDGQPVADVEVASQQEWAISSTVEKDPFGNVDGVPDGEQAYPAEPELQYAVTDENGRFELQVASDAKASLTVNDGEGHYAAAENVEPDSRNVTLRLEQAPSFKVRVAARDNEALGDGWVDLYADRDEAAGQSVSVQDAVNGELTFFAPPGFHWKLEAAPGTELRPVGSLPPNVTLVAPERKRPLYVKQVDILY